MAALSKPFSRSSVTIMKSRVPAASTVWNTNALPEEQQAKLIELLNRRLADAIDLQLQSRQAYWNVKGPHFMALRELFDKVARGVEEYANLIAGQLGGMAEGTAHAVARRTSLDEYLLATADGNSHIDALTATLAAFGKIEPFPDGGEYACLTTLPDPDLQPEEQVELHELRELLLDAIETLPVRYRAVVLLRYNTQLSYREIGQALSIPEATAKTYFYRARKPLRTLLGPEFAYY